MAKFQLIIDIEVDGENNDKANETCLVLDQVKEGIERGCLMGHYPDWTLTRIDDSDGVHKIKK